ncbi:hypothetical protein KCP71_05535 [Salmonella enterica subsp. enterica]|nr:hypothetical protein KCP71_05535 [Salmonella enterica subsp. enterica]
MRRVNGRGLKVIRGSKFVLFKQGKPRTQTSGASECRLPVLSCNPRRQNVFWKAVWGFFSAYALVFIVSIYYRYRRRYFSAASAVATLNNPRDGLRLLITSPV